MSSFSSAMKTHHSALLSANLWQPASPRVFTLHQSGQTLVRRPVLLLSSLGSPMRNRCSSPLLTPASSAAASEKTLRVGDLIVDMNGRSLARASVSRAEEVSWRPGAISLVLLPRSWTMSTTVPHCLPWLTSNSLATSHIHALAFIECHSYARVGSGSSANQQLYVMKTNLNV